MGISENEKLVEFLTEGMKVLNLKSIIEFDRESPTELWIKLPDLGVYVYSDAVGGRRKTIRGEVEVPEFQVFTVATTAATREQPEDEDLQFRRAFPRVDDAVAEVFALVVKDTIYNMIEASAVGS